MKQWRKNQFTKLYKQLMQFNFKKTTNPIKKKKWAEDLNRQFSREDTEMANTQERMLNITNREMQIKTTMRNV